MLFPSPAELRFIELMGGKVLTFKCLKSTKTGFPLALVLSLGKTLRGEGFKREVRVGRYYADFANDVGWVIEIDGKAFHRDIVYEQQRDDYFKLFDWRVLRIDAAKLWNSGQKVQRNVLKFLYK